DLAPAGKSLAQRVAEATSALRGFLQVASWDELPHAKPEAAPVGVPAQRWVVRAVEDVLRDVIGQGDVIRVHGTFPPPPATRRCRLRAASWRPLPPRGQVRQFCDLAV